MNITGATFSVLLNQIGNTVITSFTPTSAAVGSSVIISGLNFSGITAVSFGGVAATSFTVVSSTAIVATVGAGASGNITVTGSNGTATIDGFTFLVPVPTITTFSPVSGTIGTTVTITGANLLALNITGNGTYTIPNTYFSSSVQTSASSAVTLHLTTDRGQYTSTGTTLTTLQPVAYSVNSITASFPSNQVPYFNLNQSFNWTVSVTGTTASGNLTYSGGSVTTTSLTSNGSITGTSTSIDSTSSYTVTTSDYYGAGLNGYGNRTIPSTVNGTVTAATKYYPLFYKTTSSSANPNFTTSDTYLTHNYVLGDGASTTATTSNWLWIAVPGTSSHTFAYTFGGFVADVTPEATYTGQTIAGYTYNVYGFTNYSAITFLYTVT